MKFSFSGQLEEMKSTTFATPCQIVEFRQFGPDFSGRFSRNLPCIWVRGANRRQFSSHQAAKLVRFIVTLRQSKDYQMLV